MQWVLARLGRPEIVAVEAEEWVRPGWKLCRTETGVCSTAAQSFVENFYTSNALKKKFNVIN